MLSQLIVALFCFLYPSTAKHCQAQRAQTCSQEPNNGASHLVMTHKRLPDTRLSKISQSLSDSNKSCGILATHTTFFSIWIIGFTGSPLKILNTCKPPRDFSTAFSRLAPRDAGLSLGQSQCSSTAAEASNEAWQWTSERTGKSIQNPVTRIYYNTARRQKDLLYISFLLGQQHQRTVRSAGTDRNELFC